MKDEKRGRGKRGTNPEDGSGAILKNKALTVKASCQGGEYGVIPTQTKSTVRDDHRKLWGRVKKRFSDNLDKSDEKEIKFVKINADVLLDIVKGEREAWGLIDEESDECLDEAASFAEEMERLTAPFGAGAALDGEEEI